MDLVVVLVVMVIIQSLVEQEILLQYHHHKVVLEEIIQHHHTLVMVQVVEEQAEQVKTPNLHHMDLEELDCNFLPHSEILLRLLVLLVQVVNTSGSLVVAAAEDIPIQVG